MGLLNRIFSIGSKGSKKCKPQPDSGTRQSELDRIEEEQEVVASQLLRSSSARFAVISELDYTSLPPIPHPINNVVQGPATPTTVCSASMNRRGTYNVTVHRRTTNDLPVPAFSTASTRTEFMTPKLKPNKNTNPAATPSEARGALTPREQSRLHVLRSDPSVASLLEMYDEHGCLDSLVFSNTPPSFQNEGRLRGISSEGNANRSTLRQLLGNPSPESADDRFDSAGEGDISWAERFLDERLSSTSSISSAGLHTPSEALFSNDPAFYYADTNSNEHSRSTSPDLSGNLPAISSMEVELSLGSVPSHTTSKSEGKNMPYRHSDARTPQRASQVFSFLKENRQQSHNAQPRLILDTDDSLPGNLLFSSNEGDSFDVTEAQDSLEMSPLRLLSLRTRSNAALPFPSASSPVMPSTSRGGSLHEEANSHKAHGPRPSNNIPRRARPLPRLPIPNPFPTPASLGNASVKLSNIPVRTSNTSVFVEMGPDALLDVPCWTAADPFARRPDVQMRALRTGHTLSEDADPFVEAVGPHDRKPQVIHADGRHEDGRGGTRPVTPLRPRSVVLLQPVPSPASSSELSPIAQQLMANLRLKRIKARQGENSRRGLFG